MTYIAYKHRLEFGEKVPLCLTLTFATAVTAPWPHELAAIE
jgi:hypothetical protein